MKVVDNRRMNKETAFGNINIGQGFVWDNSIFIKTYHNSGFDVECDEEIEFSSETGVQPVNLKIFVED